jgi:Holliday junction resolvase RusA-like endonuclease
MIRTQTDIVPSPWHWPDLREGATVLHAVITWPISFNAYKNRQQHTTHQGRIWRINAIEQVYAQCGGEPEPMIGPVGIWWELFPPNNNIRRDLDNFTGKHILDMLVKARVIGDDQQVAEEHKFKRPKIGKGYLSIIVAEL